MKNALLIGGMATGKSCLANALLEKEFPKRIKKEHKMEIIDCGVIFMKFISVNYDYFPAEQAYLRDFNRIIKTNIEKLKIN